MRTLEQLEQNKKAKRQQRRLPAPQEEMEEELDRPKFIPLNKTKSLFDSGSERTFSGINTAPSVFDLQAAIRTDE